MTLAKDGVEISVTVSAACRNRAVPLIWIEIPPELHRGSSAVGVQVQALGREPSPEDPDCLTAVARDEAGRAQGYLHLVPCYGPEPGYSLDQMRRRPETPNGLVEWMVATTTLELGRRGVGRFSLNFSFLGALFRPETRLSPLQRLEVAVARRLNPFFQIERLHDFNAKFFPEWAPRYIYYEPPLSLPRVALAYLEAEAFLRLPLIGARSRFRARPERLGPEAPAARPETAASAG
jgi:lysyl-tRNA synthetase, class II